MIFLKGRRTGSSRWPSSHSMKTLLFVDCCIRRDASRTRTLAEAFLSHLPV